MSDRVLDLLMIRCGERREGWVFPANSAAGHLTTLDKQFREARKAAGLPKNLARLVPRLRIGAEERGVELTLDRAGGSGRRGGLRLDVPAVVVSPEVAGEVVAQLREAVGERVGLAVGRDLEEALEHTAVDEELDGGRLDGAEHLPLAVPDEDLRAARHLRTLIPQPEPGP